MKFKKKIVLLAKNMNRDWRWNCKSYGPGNSTADPEKPTEIIPPTCFVAIITLIRQRLNNQELLQAIIFKTFK